MGGRWGGIIWEIYYLVGIELMFTYFWTPNHPTSVRIQWIFRVILDAIDEE